MEYVRGRDLFDVIGEIGLLQQHEAKFYISQILIILDYLHERQIIYRDLKPENLIVDSFGYLKMIDFGTAKFLNAT